MKDRKDRIRSQVRAQRLFQSNQALIYKIAKISKNKLLDYYVRERPPYEGEHKRVNTPHTRNTNPAIFAILPLSIWNHITNHVAKTCDEPAKDRRNALYGGQP